MEIPLPIIVLFVLVCFAALLIPWYNRRSRSLLRRWADKHGYRILHREDRIVRQGPYSLHGSTTLQTVYYVTVEDQNGHEAKRLGPLRRGRPRCAVGSGGVSMGQVVADDGMTCRHFRISAW